MVRRSNTSQLVSMPCGVNEDGSSVVMSAGMACRNVPPGRGCTDGLAAAGELAAGEPAATGGLEPAGDAGAEPVDAGEVAGGLGALAPQAARTRAPASEVRPNSIARRVTGAV